MQKLRTLTDRYYQKLIAPRSQTPDERRRELILNTLLCGLALISLMSDFASVINHSRNNSPDETSSVAIVLGFSVLIFTMWALSRRGYHRVLSYVLLGILFLGATQLMLSWSFELPSAQVVFIMLVVFTGVLVNARAALRLTLALIVYISLVSYAQVSGILHPDISWISEELQVADAVGFIAGLLIIGLVSWLANRETDRSLERARRSEAALAVERDQLEMKVVERTTELERAQLERVMELQRLAEFGRLSAGLLHDVANPLTAASLNLKELGTKSQSLLVSQALQSMNYIERFLASARKQLKSQGSVDNFVVGPEIKQVISILNHRAREASVKIDFKAPVRFKLLGDPVKFSQITANLILNAIEAYGEDEMPSQRVVTIEAKQQGKWTIIVVTDRGRGLTDQQMERIFDTFYSTKDTSSSNMGIGLATVKRLAENDFGGRVKVTSSKRGGTRFTVYLKDSPGEDK